MEIQNTSKSEITPNNTEGQTQFEVVENIMAAPRLQEAWVRAYRGIKTHNDLIYIEAINSALRTKVILLKIDNPQRFGTMLGILLLSDTIKDDAKSTDPKVREDMIKKRDALSHIINILEPFMDLRN